MISLPDRPLRILMVCDLWQGSDSYALARAFRRAGHSVTIVSDSAYWGREWRSREQGDPDRIETRVAGNAWQQGQDHRCGDADADEGDQVEQHITAQRP